MKIAWYSICFTILSSVCLTRYCVVFLEISMPLHKRFGEEKQEKISLAKCIKAKWYYGFWQMLWFTDLFSCESGYDKVTLHCWKFPSFILYITSLHYNSMALWLIKKSESFGLSDFSIIEHDKIIELLYFGLAIHSSRKFFYVVSYLIIRWYSDSNRIKDSKLSRRKGYFCFRILYQ